MYAVVSNGWIVPTENTRNGFPVVETPPPDFLEYGYKAVAHYEQRGSQIVKVWDIQPWTDEERKLIEEQEEKENVGQENQEQG